MNTDLATAVGALAHRLIDTPPAILVLFVVINVCMTIAAHWNIVRRAGYPGCWSLLVFVPCVNLICLLGFAFVRWPVQGKRT